MAKRKTQRKRLCKHCNRVAVRHGLCEQHGKIIKTEHKPNHGGWSGRRVVAFRQAYLSSHPYCFDCRTIKGYTVPANVIHHIKPRCDYPELAFVESNCVALCDRCHDIRHHRSSKGDGGSEI